jgi:hypothetical protein
MRKRLQSLTLGRGDQIRVHEKNLQPGSLLGRARLNLSIVIESYSALLT